MKTVPTHWDCECAHHYIHLKETTKKCDNCGTEMNSQPDSTYSELNREQKLEFALAFVLNEFQKCYKEFDPEGEVAVWGEFFNIGDTILSGGKLDEDYLLEITAQW